jgi:hypothetical protein
MYWISVRVEPGEPTWGWLSQAGVWIATPAEAGTRPSALGSWAVVIDLPLDSVGEGLWIGEQRLPLNWLPDPSMLAVNGGEGPWRPPLGAELPQRLLDLAAADSRSPASRWRYRLLTEGLKPEPLDTESGGASGPLADPVLEALARQTEGRWRVAMAMLWAADPDLCERVKRRLAAALDFGNGVVAPAWPTDRSDLDALLADLLTPHIEPARRAERASVWLESLAPAAAWVIDDAGLRDAASGGSVTTCGVANLSERATLAWGSPEHEAPPPDLTTLPPLQARPLAIVTPLPAPDSPPRVGATPITLHAGRWTTNLAAASDRLKATPPGIRITALIGDWTMTAFLAGAPDELMGGDGERATAGLLFRGPGEGWTLHVECRRPARDQAARETVRVWLGPYGSPSAVLKVYSDGMAVDERNTDPATAGFNVSIASDPTKWTAQIPIPSDCIERDGTVRIGIERMDNRGRRTAWPRPMLPWQIEPGRVAVDLSAWAGVPTPAPATPASTTR